MKFRNAWDCLKCVGDMKKQHLLTSVLIKGKYSLNFRSPNLAACYEKLDIETEMKNKQAVEMVKWNLHLQNVHFLLSKVRYIFFNKYNFNTGTFLIMKA